MGQVYRARDVRLGRDVALRILPGETNDARGERRLLQEARTAGALNHPNIVVVHDVGLVGGTPYIVSELVDGGTLRGEIQSRAIPIRRLLHFAVQIADGLAAAHEAGIMHRDLKPENIMVTRAGRIKIVDFGLAMATPVSVRAEPRGAGSQWPTVSEPALIAGTAPYMSPEQALGRAVDYRSDQFSLGSILYEMATGKPAFARDSSVETLAAIVKEEPQPLTIANPELPAPFRWTVERCLAKEPHERYGATVDLYRDLRTQRDRWAEAVADQTTIPAAARRWRGALLMIALATLSIGVGFLVRSISSLPQADLSRYVFTPLATEIGFEGFPAWSPDGKTIAYAAEVDGVLQIFTRNLTSSTAAPITRSAFDCKFPFWSPDGKRILYTSLIRDAEGIWSISAAGGGTPERVMERASRGALSPDGKTFAFVRDEFVNGVAGTAAVWLHSPPGDPQRYEIGRLRDRRFIEAALGFSPDGRQLGVFGGINSDLQPEQPSLERGVEFWIIPLSSGEPRRALYFPLPHVVGVGQFSWFPDSRHVVLDGAGPGLIRPHLLMADLETGVTWPLTATPDAELHPSLSPQGTRLAFTSDHSEYDVIEVSMDRHPIRTVLSSSRNESDPVWSPDGSLLAYVTDRRGMQEIVLKSRDGRFERPLMIDGDWTRETLMLSDLAFSLDGRRIAFTRSGRQPLRIWYSAIDGSPPVPLLPEYEVGYFSSPTWSPDGEWIAYATWQRGEWLLAKIRVGGEGPVVLARGGAPNADPKWSPKGEWITWQTESGLTLVSPEGQSVIVSDQRWLVHGWSSDGTRIHGIRQTDQSSSEGSRLEVITMDLRSKRETKVADLGPAPVANNPVVGFSMAPDGRSFLTSIVRLRGDVWLLDGFERPRQRWNWLWPFRPR